MSLATKPAEEKLGAMFRSCDCYHLKTPSPASVTHRPAVQIIQKGQVLTKFIRTTFLVTNTNFKNLHVAFCYHLLGVIAGFITNAKKILRKM